MSLELVKRPPFYAKKIGKFIDFLNEKYPIEPLVKVEILDSYLLVGTDIEEHCGVEWNISEIYGLYEYKTGTILVAAGMFYPNWSPMILIILAHEFYHVRQHIRKKKWDERQADVFSLTAMDSFIQSEEKFSGS